MENNMNIYTVVDTDTQSVKEIKSNATTVAELKRDLRKAGIKTENVIIQEALTRIELIDDSSLLPKNVNYKGNITNNLVFRITKANKHIKSGNDRAELYFIIKENHLEQKVKDYFGRNYTQVSSENLKRVCNEFKEDSQIISGDLKNAKSDAHINVNIDTNNCACNCKKCIETLCQILQDYSILTDVDQCLIFNNPINKSTEDNVYSDKELNELLSNL